MKILSKRQQDTYLKLIQELPLVSIKSEEHLDAAQAMIDRLTNQKKLDGGEQAYLDALCDLVVVYEDQYHQIPAASDADLLRHLMEAKGVTQVQLHKEAGLAKSGISEVLAGKKPFSRGMIGALAAYFHVPTSVFVANIGKTRHARSRGRPG
ncbi:MAG TPA: helix-turn-helix domain-containing protein [Pirellulales bacterium]